MNEAMWLGVAWITGVLLGGIFFGGLWLTVHKLVSSQWSGPWFLGSLILRMSIILAGFYFIGNGHWERLLVCLLGLMMARLVVMRITRGAKKPEWA